MPDPDRWPAKLATYLSIARSKLNVPGSLLLFSDFLMLCMAEEGMEGSPEEYYRERTDERLRVSELEYLAVEVFNRMVADGEAFGVASQNPRFTRELAKALGWEQPGTWGMDGPGALRPTARLIELKAASRAERSTWQGVEELTRQARQAYAHGLYVAAAAAGRVAAEQAVLEALEALSESTDGKPHAREDRLFTTLKPSAFKDQPIDHSATKAELSATRALGNQAAHEGSVEHAAVQEALTQLLPQALMSLFGAVQATSTGR